MTAPRTFGATAEEIAMMIADFYELPGNTAGGLAHVILDDENIDNYFLNYCREEAVQAGDQSCITILDLLRERGLAVRKRIIRRGHDIMWWRHHPSTDNL